MLSLGLLTAWTGTGFGQTRPTGPCDLYGSATPCVAAFSTTRALYAAYTGALYQVTRASDGTTASIGILSSGYANAATQDSFCANTTCTISEIYDQSPHHNNLTLAPPGGAARGQGPGGDDLGAVANAAPAEVGGQKVYGVYIAPGEGYRNDNTSGIPINGAPEGVYMVSSTINLNDQCCFDFGNAETNNDDNGKGHMDAINLICNANPCSSVGAGLDMEDGIYPNPGLGVTSGISFVTAMGWNDGQRNYQIYQGNAQWGSLTTTGSTALPSSHYAPMHQEGAIILGIGGDNSNGASGYFFEGVMTNGTPSTTAMNSVQANIVGAGYGLPTIGFLNASGEFLAKDGALTSAWVGEANGSASIASGGNRLGYIDTSGSATFWVKSGLTGAWIGEANGAARIAVSENVLGYLDGNGTFWVKQGGLTAAWVNEASGAKQIVVSDNAIGYLDSNGEFWAKTGTTGAWTGEASGVAQIAISNNVLGVIGTDGTFSAKQGITGPWIGEANGAVAIAVSDKVLGFLDANGEFWAKSGLTGSWVGEANGAAKIAVSDNILGYLGTNGTFYAKQSLTGAWIGEANGANQIVVNAP